MTQPNANEVRLFQDLLGRMRDAEITPEQEMQLEALLLRYPSLQQDYIDYLFLCESLHSSQSLAAQDHPDPSQGVWDVAFWRAMASYEQKAPAVSVEKPVVRTEVKAVSKARPAPTPKEVRLLPLILSVAALVVLMVMVVFFSGPGTSTVAVLDDAMGIVWGDEAFTPVVGTQFINDLREHTLEAGVIDLHFYSGPTVVIEGPARFAFVDVNQIALEYGRLYVKVPPEGIGFTVETPCTQIVDLGTEFGVEVDRSGVSGVHMLKGRASVLPGPREQRGPARLIETDQALHVDQDHHVRNVAIERQTFVRWISSKDGFVWRGEPISLANILAGGNGFVAGPEMFAIDPSSGAIIEGNITGQSKADGSEGYFQVPSLSGVDGVFVPGQRSNPLVVSSAGHLFEDCPETSLTYFTAITGTIALRQQGSPDFTARMGGILYGTAETPAIYMHANGGVTFDLMEIQNHWPQFSMTAFTATCGVVEGENLGNRVVFLALVDGQQRAEFHAVSDIAVAPGEINVSLTPDDRFLTLMTLDGGDDSDHDWALFGKPYLTLEEK